MLVAFHFPPLGESSGLQRTLSLANDLAERGWNPIVLTVRERAYRVVRPEQLADIDSRVTVHRAWAVDTARDLSIRGKYPRVLALPDVWSSWLIGGVVKAVSIIRRYKPEFVWSTYPIATAHLLALATVRLTRLPWIADFRDSMTEDAYPDDPAQRSVYRWIERQVVETADHCIFTTPGALAMYSARYPPRARRFRVIANGYDERYFAPVDAARAAHSWRPGTPVTLLHSGVVYPSERDPTQLLDALQQLKADGLDGKRLKVILRASGFDRELRPFLEERSISDIVLLEPGIAYGEALKEMGSVDGLLILQASNCNHQIPAKLYEYIRSGTPIVALTDPTGDTASVIRDIGGEFLAPLNDTEAIKDVLRRFVAKTEASAHVHRVANVERFSRRTHVLALEQLLRERSTN